MLLSFYPPDFTLYFVHVLPSRLTSFLFFFFNDTATTEIYTLSLHDALPILPAIISAVHGIALRSSTANRPARRPSSMSRSEEHTSELQSHLNLVCRLLLEKKKNYKIPPTHPRFLPLNDRHPGSQLATPYPSL